MESLADVQSQCQIMNKYGVNRVDYNGKKYIQIKNYIYDQEKVLGSGAFATVYLGLDISDQGKNMQQQPRKVAIKKINIPANRATKKQFQKIIQTTQLEVFALMSLQNNPHILKLYDFLRVKEDSCVYLILEYCNEKDLYTFLKQKKQEQHRISEVEIRYYFMQILKAFRHMRNKNFVHRDIKPQNILVKDGVLKVADFGFAKFITKNQLQQFAGTKVTAAPQVVLHQKYTNKCDIYSLGAILYWMIYDKFPIQSLHTTQQDFNQDRIKYPSQVKLSPQLKSIIQRMLKFQQPQRIDWPQLFNNRLFSESLILSQFQMRPKPILCEQMTTTSSLRHTIKQQKIENEIPSRISAYIADRLMWYEKQQHQQQFVKNIQKQLKYELGKVEFLRYVQGELAKYSVTGKNRLESEKLSIGLFKELVIMGLEKEITLAVVRVRDELMGQCYIEVFDGEEVELLGKNPVARKELMVEVNTQVKFQESRSLQLQEEAAELKRKCTQYKIIDEFELLFRDISITPAKFEQQFCMAILQLIYRLKLDVPDLKQHQDVSKSKDTIIIVHLLFMVYMREEIFTKKNRDTANFNYFFEREKQMTQELNFNKLQARIRQLLMKFV